MTKPRRRIPKDYREPVPGEWGSDAGGWSGFAVIAACLGIVAIFGILAWQSLTSAGIFGAVSTFILVMGPRVWKFFQELAGD